MEKLPTNESQDMGPREKFEDMEKRREHVRDRIKHTHELRREGSRLTLGHQLNSLDRRRANIDNMMNEIKGKAQEEATKLNERHNELTEKAKEALQDLHDFEVSELGIQDSDTSKE